MSKAWPARGFIRNRLILPVRYPAPRGRKSSCLGQMVESVSDAAFCRVLRRAANNLLWQRAAQLDFSPEIYTTTLSVTFATLFVGTSIVDQRQCADVSVRYEHDRPSVQPEFHAGRDQLNHHESAGRTERQELRSFRIRASAGILSQLLANRWLDRQLAGLPYVES